MAQNPVAWLVLLLLQGGRVVVVVYFGVMSVFPYPSHCHMHPDPIS